MTLCPVCGGAATLRSVVSIDRVPVYCNVLWETVEEALEAPLGQIDLVFCGRCGHLFNESFDAGKTDYTQDYENSLHFSPRFNEYAGGLADRLIEVYDIRRKNVIEIGCGKGDFLAMLCVKGDNRGYGFDRSYDPARADLGSTPDITFVQDFYGPQYTDLPVDLVCCRHVVEHLESPTDFLRDLHTWLGGRSDVVLYFEVPNALYTVRELGIWDLIYEHCSYFTEHSLRQAFSQAGYEVLSSRVAFGGQYLQIEARPGEVRGVSHPLTSSEAQGLSADIEAFNRKYINKLARWNTDLGQQAGQSSVVWGGGSKGVTFLNILSEAFRIDRLVDINPHKQGKFVPGTGQRVISPAELVDDPPDRVIVMNEVYREEISRRLAELGINSKQVAA